MRSAKIWILALSLILPIAAMTATRAEAGAAVSLSLFYDSLAPYGSWHASADFGYVWSPAHVSVGWRPYVDGRWAYSEVGWTFVSDAPWGWGPYHYGRWYLDPYYGWVWVPGVEWAPAWVTFYQGPGLVGWAPLPPRVSIGVALSGPIRVDPRAYSFVESRYFLDPYVGRRIRPIGSNVTLVRSVRDVTRFDRVHGIAVNRGLAVDQIERETHTRVRTFRLNDQPDVSHASRAQLHGDSISVFRPRVESRAAHAPKVTPGRPARFESSSVHDARQEKGRPPATAGRSAHEPRPEPASYVTHGGHGGNSGPAPSTSHSTSYASRGVATHATPASSTRAPSPVGPAHAGPTTHDTPYAHNTEHRPMASSAAVGKQSAHGSQKQVVVAPARSAATSGPRASYDPRGAGSVQERATVSHHTDNAKAHGGKSATSKKKPAGERKPPSHG